MGEARRLIIENSSGGLRRAGERNDDKASEFLISLILRSNSEERAEVLAVRGLEHFSDHGRLTELRVHVAQDCGHRRLR
jgi:hypothetical protein